MKTTNRKSSHLIRFQNNDVLAVFSPEVQKAKDARDLSALGANLAERIAAKRAAERKGE